MELIKTMINHVFIPILTILFICSGLLAAVTSATIEYSVFISLFTSVQQIFISPSLLALLFVIPLEYTKIFSHYLNGKLHEASPSFSKHFTRKVGVLVLIPTLISLACSIIFSINALDLAYYHVFCPKSNCYKHDLPGNTLLYADLLADKPTAQSYKEAFR